jgi:hypothetical protein
MELKQWLEQLLTSLELVLLDLDLDEAPIASDGALLLSPLN